MVNSMVASFPSRRGIVWTCLLALWSVGVSGQDPATPTAAPTAASGTTATDPPVTAAAPTAAGWQGCEDATLGNKLVTIGETTTICLSIADGTDWSSERTYMRVNFQPLADEYSRFLVPSSFNDLVLGGGNEVQDIFNGKNVTVHVSSQKAISFQKLYYNGDDKVFPFLTAIVDVQEGVVQGIAWDDASIFCGPNRSERNTFDFAGVAGTENRFGQPVDGCYLAVDECTGDASAEATTCDLLLYVVWTGTDSNGRSFMSSSYRYSAFPPQDWADRLTQNLPEFPELPEFPDINPLNNDSE